jgi:CRISPR-associated protein Cas1
MRERDSQYLRRADVGCRGTGRILRSSLDLARRLVAAKVHNSRVLLRRNGEPEEVVLKQLRRQVGRAEKAADLEQLLRCEGSAAKLYFSSFQSMLKGDAAPRASWSAR